MTDAPEPKKRPPRKLLRHGIQAALGLVVGLGIAEAGFSARDGGAFPHLNLYEADAELGVRLRPNSSMRFQLGDNPLTTIHVGADGFRDDGTAHQTGGIVVVGDSQVFGLGVQDDETFSAQLEARTGTPTMNAGVPTYGPLEYIEVSRRLIEEKKPDTLVYTLNMLNDGFELERQNEERHAVWDGWAVRAETAPEGAVAFPGRRWLMSRSHLVFAFRQWMNDGGDSTELREVALPSEGTWNDLVSSGREVVTERTKREETRKDISGKRRAVDQALADQKTKVERARIDLEDVDSDYQDPHLERVAKGKAGDIVDNPNSESSRPMTLTADQIARAAKELRELKKEKKKARADAQAAFAEAEKRHAELSSQFDSVAKSELPELHVPSVFAPHLRELSALCEAKGVRLVVLILPFDVQVSPEEWKKYGVEQPPDMEPTLALLDQVAEDVRRLGVEVLDLTGALRAAQPGAFLDGDIHLTPKGHRAVAEALAEIATQNTKGKTG